MKKLLYLAAIVICLVVINNLIHSIYDLWHKQDLVVNAGKELERQKEENRKLKLLLNRVQGTEFIEEEARNKLFMVKPGESGVIVPADLLEKKEKKKDLELPNWQKWINLLIGD